MRLEYSQIFVDFEENKKKRSFKRKMVLDITPNTKFVYSLKCDVHFYTSHFLIIDFIYTIIFYKIHKIIS